MLVVDETQADLAVMMLADLGALKPGAVPGRDLVDWLHYRARAIVGRPREVRMSDEVAAQRVAYPEIDTIATALKIGAPMVRWLGDRIRKRKSDPKADLMFNQWQVSHFHLGPQQTPGAKATRGKPLLFAHVGADTASLLDVQPHRTWTRTDLLRILLRVDPSAMHDIGPAEVPALTDAQHRILRNRHTTGPITIDDRSYAAPGWGLMSSGDSLRFRIMADHLAHMIGETIRLTEANALPWPLLPQLAGQIGVPVRLGVRFDQGIFVIYDKIRSLDLMQLNRVVA